MPFFLSAKTALTLLRCSLALVFLAHSVVRIVNSSVPQLGQFLTAKGLPAGTLSVCFMVVAAERT